MPTFPRVFGTNELKRVDHRRWSQLCTGCSDDPQCLHSSVAIDTQHPDVLYRIYRHQNFAMIQLADTVCSAVMFPMIMDAFGEHLAGISNVHTSGNYGIIRDRYKQAIRDMQFLYHNGSRIVGGMLISDRLPENRSSALLFH